MENSRFIPELTSREIRERARYYRLMAESAKAPHTREAFLRVAERLEARAAELEDGETEFPDETPP